MAQHMSDMAFEQAVDAALDSLPEDLLDRVDNVELVIEHEDGDEPDIYGLYTGIPLTERTGDGYAGALPDRIAIYRRPLIADFGHDPAELVRQIRITVLHEIAHHFGIDDRRLNELGWA